MKYFALFLFISVLFPRLIYNPSTEKWVYRSEGDKLKYSVTTDKWEYVPKNTKTKLKYSDKTDVWSLGMCILEIIGTRIPSFKNLENHIEYVKNINDSFIEERVKLYNNNKMSKKE